MGTQQMISTLKFNRQQKSERKRLHELDLSTTNGGYGEFVDHKQMDLLAYAEFQKEQFAKKKEARRKRIRFGIFIGLLTIVLILSFLLLWNQIDFDIWSSPTFQ
ncbi:MAG: hypothetical protein KTR22_13485 [Flavobacteriaceae bacterium]|nr:hypothetical protein [Flavobacteriaceae bacterium]